MSYLSTHKKSIIESLRLDKKFFKQLLIELLFIITLLIIALLFYSYINKLVYEVFKVIQPIISGGDYSIVSSEIVHDYTIFLWKSISAIIIFLILVLCLNSIITIWHYSLLKKSKPTLRQFWKYLFSGVIFLLSYFIIIFLLIMFIKNISWLSYLYILFSIGLFYLFTINYAILWDYGLIDGFVNTIKYALKIIYTLVPFIMIVVFAIVVLSILNYLSTLFIIDNSLIMLFALIISYLFSAVFIKRYLFYLSKYLRI